MKQFSYSIIIPCFNCATTIGMCLDSIINQKYIDFEVIVVDDMSLDATNMILQDYVKKDNRIHLVNLMEKGFAGGARNTGMKVSTKEIFVFLDSDVVIQKDYLSHLNEVYNHYPEAAGVAGSVINPYRSLLSNTSLIMAMSEQLPIGKPRLIRTAPTINLSYKREAVQDVFFLEKNTAAEDTLFTNNLSNAGKKLIFIPTLHVIHHHRRLTLKSIIEREKFYARGFVMSRRLYNLPNKFLLKKKFFLFLFPRIFLFLKRTFPSFYFFKYLQSLPIIFYCELLRTIEIIRTDRIFLQNWTEMKNEYRSDIPSKLAYSVISPHKEKPSD